MFRNIRKELNDKGRTVRWAFGWS